MRSWRSGALDFKLWTSRWTLLATNTLTVERYMNSWENAPRMVTTIKIDDRRDRPSTTEHKKEVVRRKLGGSG